MGPNIQHNKLYKGIVSLVAERPKASDFRKLTLPALLFSSKIMLSHSQREKFPNLEFFWSALTRIETECGKIFLISPY